VNTGRLAPFQPLADAPATWVWVHGRTAYVHHDGVIDPWW